MAFAILLLSGAGAAAGQTRDVEVGTRFTQDEFRTLPRYCWASATIDKSLTESLLSEQERQQWYDYMGKDFMHIHHFCWALLEVRRGNRAVDSRIREAQYRAAITDFDYVIRRCNNKFPLKPEFHLRKAMTLRLMGDDASAASEFTRAIQLKSDYTPAYSGLAELHLDLGNTSEAMKVVEEGLKKAPSSKILVQMKAMLQDPSDQNDG